MGLPAGEVRQGPGEGQGGEQGGQGLDGIAPAPVDVVPRVAPGKAGQGDGKGLSRSRRAGGQGAGEGLPPPACRSHHGGAQVEAVGVEQVPGPRQPGRVHLPGSGQAHLLGHREDDPHRAPLQLPAQQPEDGGVAQAVVRPQGGPAVRPQKAVRRLRPDGVPLRFIAAARPDGAHHVHVALEDGERRAPAPRGGGQVGG